MENAIRRFEIVEGYENANINLPRRATTHAAGYDFEAAEDITIPSIWKTVLSNKDAILLGGDIKEDIKPTLVPTGIKALFPTDEVLYLYNRSSGPKNGRILANSVGVIDADYYYTEDAKGHIKFAFYNYSLQDIIIKKGERIGQGVFQKYLITDDDIPGEARKGGFGDSGKN